MFSSPPGSSEVSPVVQSSSEIFGAPVLLRQRVTSPQHLSSPPDGQDGGPSGLEADRGRLKSSAVNGYAGRSLLGLRKERR